MKKCKKKDSFGKELRRKRGKGMGKQGESSLQTWRKVRGSSFSSSDRIN